jgi:hypothetical protein
MPWRMATAAGVIATALALAVTGTPAASTPPCPHPPDIDPANFGGPIDNQYFPLKPGTTYKYKGNDEGDSAVDVVTVTHTTKQIDGVTATVVKDRLFVKGKLAEDTRDWYAQDKDGTVWYFGEDTKELDKHGKVVSTEGSWEAGVNDAKPGIFMPAHPQAGQVFQQEYAKGVAEDCFKVVSLGASVDVPYVSSHHALETKEWTRLESGKFDHKRYVRRVGLARDQGPDDLLELVSVKSS